MFIRTAILSRNILLDLGDDRQALIWDISPMPRPVEDPILAYQAEGEVIFADTINKFKLYASNFLLFLMF